jgi:hypothetical protein
MSKGGHIEDPPSRKQKHYDIPSFFLIICCPVARCQLNLDFTPLSTFENSEDHEIWFLLTRHVIEKQRSSEYIALLATELETTQTEYEDNEITVKHNPKVRLINLMSLV